MEKRSLFDLEQPLTPGFRCTGKSKSEGVCIEDQQAQESTSPDLPQIGTPIPSL